MKAEMLSEAIGNLDDKYLEEAAKVSEMRVKKMSWGKRRIGIGAAAVVLVGIVCIAMKMIWAGHQKIPVVEKGDFELTVLADEGKKMEPGVSVEWCEYSPTMSHLIAMPFTFVCEPEGRGEIEIVVTVEDYGILQKWKGDEDGHWHCEEDGKELTCKSGDTIYWTPYDESAESDGDDWITVKVMENGQCVEKEEIEIQYVFDRNVYIATVR